MPDILVHIDDYSVKQIKNDICIKGICDGDQAIFSESEKAGGMIALAAEKGMTEITIAFPQPKPTKENRKGKSHA